MAIFFVAFIGSTPLDFYGKAAMKIVAVALLIRLAVRVRVSPPTRAK
jgi:hypothetical protein